MEDNKVLIDGIEIEGIADEFLQPAIYHLPFSLTHKTGIKIEGILEVDEFNFEKYLEIVKTNIK